VARARTHVWRLNSEDNRAAIEALQRTVDSWPYYEPARSLLGVCLVFAAHNGWIDPTKGMTRGREHTLRAIELDHRTTWGQIALGYLRMMEKRTVEAIAAFETAVRLHPSSAAAHCYLSRGLAFSGRDREAIEHAETAIRLSPMDPEMALVYGCLAVVTPPAATISAALFRRTLRCGRVPRRAAPRCAALAQLGRATKRGSISTGHDRAAAAHTAIIGRRPIRRRRRWSAFARACEGRREGECGMALACRGAAHCQQAGALLAQRIDLASIHLTALPPKPSGCRPAAAVSPAADGRPDAHVPISERT
jgi:tetratricopeptide (TPR) repeat protein